MTEGKVAAVYDAPVSRLLELAALAAEYIQEHCPEETVAYDGTDCDGYCLADDLHSACDDLRFAHYRTQNAEIARLTEVSE